MGDGAAARGPTCPDPHHRSLHPNNFSLDFPHLLVLFQGDTPMDELYECMELDLIKKNYIYGLLLSSTSGGVTQAKYS